MTILVEELHSKGIICMFKSNKSNRELERSLSLTEMTMFLDLFSKTNTNGFFQVLENEKHVFSNCRLS